MADQDDGPFLQNLDRASAIAIARLQIQENEQYSARMQVFRRGQTGETDEELALRLDLEYLQQQIAELLQQEVADAAGNNDGHEAVGEATDGGQEEAVVGPVTASALSNGMAPRPTLTVFQ